MRRVQMLELAAMLVISLILLLATFPVDAAGVSPPTPEPEGFYFEWRCSDCIYETWQCPSGWMKICERWFCEQGYGCIYVGPTKTYCCNP